jgi:hypothetical protein
MFAFNLLDTCNNFILLEMIILLQYSVPFYLKVGWNPQLQKKKLFKLTVFGSGSHLKIYKNFGTFHVLPKDALQWGN